MKKSDQISVAVNRKRCFELRDTSWVKQWSEKKTISLRASHI